LEKSSDIYEKIDSCILETVEIEFGPIRNTCGAYVGVLELLGW